jgi:hypothetical protein
MSAEMEVIFSIQSRLFAVFRDADGSTHWSDYDGKKVSTAFPSDDGTRCVVLSHPDALVKTRFENLFCVDRDGKTVWTAELQDKHDRYVDANMESDGLHASTCSCYHMTLDPADGRVIRRVFTK